MKLYRWHSEYLCNYSKGDIIVVANDVEEARKIAFEEFQRHVRECRFWAFEEPEELGDFLIDEYYDCLSIFKEDIASEPEEIDTRVLFISGSG